eukprot:3940067-Rhodomonas_salina.1
MIPSTGAAAVYGIMLSEALHQQIHPSLVTEIGSKFRSPGTAKEYQQGCNQEVLNFVDLRCVPQAFTKFYPACRDLELRFENLDPIFEIFVLILLKIETCEITEDKSETWITANAWPRPRDRLRARSEACDRASWDYSRDKERISVCSARRIFSSAISFKVRRRFMRFCEQDQLLMFRTSPTISMVNEDRLCSTRGPWVKITNI